MLHDPTVHRLGRLPAKRAPTLFKLARYVNQKKLPAAPSSRVWSSAVKFWGMMKNNEWGDCSIAGRGHHHLLRTTLAGDPDMPTDESITADYVAVTGEEGAAFDPETGTNDNGCILEDVLSYYRKKGQIGAYAYLDPTNIPLLKFTINAFEGAYVGLSLPLTAQDQDVWDVTDDTLQGAAAPGSWGGHCIIIVDYECDKRGNLVTLTCVTWGQLKKMTLAFWLAYADPKNADGEAYAVLSPEMLSKSGAIASGFNMATLQGDLAAL